MKTVEIGYILSNNRLFYMLQIVFCFLFVSNVLSAEYPQGYRVGAWYFPVWRPDVAQLQVKQTEKVYGRTDAWGGVRDYAEGHRKFAINDPVTGKPVDFSSRKPKLGFYDLRSEEVLKSQIEQAKQGGLSFFAFYWYWDTDTNSEPYDTIKRFQHADPKGVFGHILAGITLGKGRITLADWSDKVVPIIVNQYFSHPGYVKIKGRPVFIDFNLKFDSLNTGKTAYDILRKVTRAKLGIEPFVLKRVGDNTRDEHLRYFFSAQKADGLTCFNFPVDRPNEAYAETTQRWQEHLEYWMSVSASGQTGRNTFIPCGTTGFDARPWYMIGWGPWMNRAYSKPDLRPYNSKVTAKEFSHHLKGIKALLDRFPLETQKMAIIYAWNEWGEGGILEAADKNDAGLLNEVLTTFRVRGSVQSRP